jgi:hypothetical protein
MAITLSLDTGATLYKLQKSIAYALFFVLALAQLSIHQVVLI